MPDHVDTGPTAGRSPSKDRLMGRVKRTIGSVLGRQDLSNEGQLQAARADAVEQARATRQRADQREEAARVAARQQELEVERARIEAEEAEAAGRRQTQLDKAREDAEVTGQAAAAEQAVQRQGHETERAIDADERRAAEQRLAAEARAGRLQAAAEREEATADALDPSRS